MSDTQLHTIPNSGSAVRPSVSKDDIAAFCRRHHIRKLSLFGSVLRADFRLDSDVDVLVEFDPATPVGFMALARLQRELSELLHRRVDLVPKAGLKTVIRQSVLDSARVIYAI